MEKNYRPSSRQRNGVVRTVFQNHQIRDLEICWFFFAWRNNVGSTCKLNLLGNLNRFVSDIHKKYIFGRILPKYNPRKMKPERDIVEQVYLLQENLLGFLFEILDIENDESEDTEGDSDVDSNKEPDVSSDEDSDEDSDDNDSFLNEHKKEFRKLQVGLMSGTEDQPVTKETCLKFIGNQVGYPL